MTESKKRHYIGASRDVVTASFGEWSEDNCVRFFDDVTHGMTCVRYVPMQPNTEGPRFGLVGRTLRVLAGMERSRKGTGDTLFVFTAAYDEVARHWPTPTEYRADFEPLPTRRGAGGVLDRIPFLEGIPATALAPQSSADGQVPNRDLAAAIAGASRDVLELSRPGVSVANLDASAWDAALKSLWMTFRLHECVPATYSPRNKAILGGAISSIQTPEVLGALTRGIGVGVLNRAATRHRYPERLRQLLVDLARLPIAPSVRACLWAWALRPLEPDQFREELHRVAVPLANLAKEEETATVWSESIVRTLQFLATTDPGLKDICERARQSDSPLLEIAKWATDLRLAGSAATVEVPLTTQLPVSTTVSNVAEVQPPVAERIVLHPLTVVESDGRSLGQPVETNLPSLPTSSVFVSWFLSFTADQVRTAKVTSEVQSVGKVLEAACSETSSPEGLLRLCRAVEGLAEAAKRWTNELPAATQLSQDLPVASDSFARAAQVIEEDDLRQLLCNGMTIWPQDLDQITKLVCRSASLSKLPAWLLRDAASATGSETPSNLAQDLASPVVRRRAVAALAVIDEFQEEPPASASFIGPPPDDADDVSYLEAELRAVYDTRAALQKAPSEHALWVKKAIDRGDEPRSIQRSVDRLEAFRPVLEVTTFGSAIGFVAESTSPEDRDQRLRRLRAGIDQVNKLLSSTAGLSWDQLKNVLSKTNASGAEEAVGALTVEHDLVDAPARRAELYCRRRSPNDAWVYVEVPLVLETEDPNDAELLLSWQELSKLRDLWASDWPGIEPTSLKVLARDWREVPDGNRRWQFPFSASIPIRRPTSSKKGESDSAPRKLEVEVSVAELSSTKAIGRPRVLSWESLYVEEPNLQVEWAEDCDPTFVRDHPVGPQSNPEEFKDRVAQGGSFAVVAPRRFGKTTLVKYLENLRDVLPVLVLPRVTTTSFLQGASVDYEGLWDQIDRSLNDSLGVGLRRPLENGLPGESAFDHARQQAKSKGHKAIVILIDEAQLLFPKDARGHDLGNRLKDRLEGPWGHSTPTMARMVLGLVGLPGLQDRAGANLMGRLQPRVRTEIDEVDLNRLLRKVTRPATAKDAQSLTTTSGAHASQREVQHTLQTTKAARQAIARFSVNLLVLRDVVRRLVKRARNAGKTWVSVSDVSEITREFKQEVRDNEGVDVAGSLRDVFNDGETINEFIPNASYPVALALAHVGFGRRSLSESDAITQSLEPLREWCVQINEANSLHTVAFDRDRVADQIDALRDRGVIRRSRFSYELLEAWLEGQARNPPLSDDSFREAVLNAASRRIRRPPAMEAIATGGEATLFRFQRRDTDLVWREVRVASDEAKRRFLEAADAIQRILRSQRRREGGSDCVFELEEMGLVDHESSIGAQVYRWIPGTDLSTRLKLLSADAVAELGMRLFGGLEWLHASSVLHRDIKPANIVLREDDSWPVLIDFGFARFATSKMTTRIAGDYAAPETLESPPRWSRAADVHCLCATLTAVLKPGSAYASKITGVLKRGLEREPGLRASAAELRVEFERLSQDFALEQRRREFWAKIDKLAAKDNNKNWYRKLLLKFQPQFEAHAIGMNADAIQRCALVADFSNQALEAGTPQTEGASLGKAKAGKMPGIDASLVELTHNLRLWKSHGNVALRAGLQKTREADLLLTTRAQASQIGTYLKLASMEDVVELLLRPSTDSR